jgi:hypothetical protein
MARDLATAARLFRPAAALGDLIRQASSAPQPGGSAALEVSGAGQVAVLLVVRDPLTAEGFTYARNAGDA